MIESKKGTAETPLQPASTPPTKKDIAISVRGLSVFYTKAQALNNISMDIPGNKITAVIGPSGCGKSTFIRCFNRMNDLIPDARIEGRVFVDGHDIYGPAVDPIVVRRHIGMVFQKPNPFPKSVYQNVAWGARINGYKGNMDELVERTLRKAALWDEVKDRLHKSALELSGGQQQRLCIARALAVSPSVMLMDEPCSALDPIATLAIEDLMRDLVTRVSIVIVTHNMQQASRVSDMTAFLLMNANRAGELIEYDMTEQLFTRPKDKRTEDYITGRFG